MQYFTAVFGESHRIAGYGLVRSFRRYLPEASLTIFTDLESAFPNARIKLFDELQERLDRFYQRPGRRNVFKLDLFKEMFNMYPREAIAWVDADTLVLGELSSQIDSARANVIAHGRRDNQEVDCGNGLRVVGSRYAIGGYFCLPNRNWLDALLRVRDDRPAWDHRDYPSELGDQILLNHVVASYEESRVHWLTDNRDFIFNLEIADGLHPYLDDPGLGSLTLRHGGLYKGTRQVLIFYWIKRQLDLHIENDFATFDQSTRSLLRSLYANTDL